MKRGHWHYRVAVALACVGMITPERAIWAATIAPQAVHDVALGDNGTLAGQVVNSQGAPLSAAEVSVWQNEHQIASTQTDAEGRFAVQGLRGGVHQVVAGEGAGVYRFWAPNTAPPSAGKQVMVVSDSNVVRGNKGGGVLAFITNPWVIAGAVAAAIAIPIALNNDDDSGS